MSSAEPTLPADTAIGRAALRVADVAPAIDFYRDVVGLAVLSRTDDRASLGVDDVSLLELRAAPEAPARRGAGLFHNAFRVPSRAALGDALARIRDRWELDGAADHGVSEALYCSDPAGNGVEIYRDRPRREWPIADDGRVAMVTAPLDLAAVTAATDGNVSAGGESTVPPGTDLGHVHLEVTALDPAREFYVETLGLRVRQEMDDSALFLAAGEYHHHVGLNTWNGRRKPAGGRGLDWFELVVPDADALAAARDRLEAAGVGVADQAGVGETVGFETADPDGIRIRLRAAT
ncbi:VOC family protein [Halovivax sp.]|uniref:VOC family protein n=1 Tax=Halovivax sp. TaxID=1935978 RepID=UPI0025C30FEA|nr:VOC family protein [Halovivax sp.]